MKTYLRTLRWALAAVSCAAVFAPAVMPTSAVAANRQCPAAVEKAIRAIPRYKHLMGPMNCNFVALLTVPCKCGIAWAFRHGGANHWYLGQAHIYRRECGGYGCYTAFIASFTGHRT